MPPRNYECRKYLSSENPTLSKGIRDSLPYFVHFCLIFIKLGKWDVNVNIYRVIASFIQIGGIKVTHYSGA